MIRLRPWRTSRAATIAVVKILVAALALAPLLPRSAYAQGGDAPGTPVITEVPDACDLLTRSDVAELLGEKVGEGTRHDVAGYPCQYSTSSGRRLTIVAHLGSGPELEGTQPGIQLAYCEAEVVRQIEDLGLDAALFRGTRDDVSGCDATTLWVATNVRFSGKTNPDLVRQIEGQFHLVLTLEPADSESQRIAVLREAAHRVIERLRE